jgi:hypothetical protein
VRYAGSGHLRGGPVRDGGLIGAQPQRLLSQSYTLQPYTLQQIRLDNVFAAQLFA